MIGERAWRKIQKLRGQKEKKKKVSTFAIEKLYLGKKCISWISEAGNTGMMYQPAPSWEQEEYKQWSYNTDLY